MTPPLNAYNLAMQYADNWDMFKALLEQSDGSKSEEEDSWYEEAYGWSEPEEDYGWTYYGEDCSKEEEKDKEPEGLGFPRST